MAELLDRRSTLVETDEERADVLHRLGRTFEIDIGALDRAVPVYNRILAFAVDHTPTIESLEQILASLREREEDEACRARR